MRLEQEQDREDFESYRVYVAGRYRGMLTHLYRKGDHTWHTYIGGDENVHRTGSRDEVLKDLLDERPRATPADYKRSIERLVANPLSLNEHDRRRMIRALRK